MTVAVIGIFRERPYIAELSGMNYELEYMLSQDFPVEAEGNSGNAEKEFRKDIAKRMVQDDILTAGKMAEYSGLAVDEVKALAAK